MIREKLREKLGKGKKGFEYLFLLVFFFTMALLVECVIFQFRALWIKEKPVTVDLQSELVKISRQDKLARLTDEEAESIRISQENQRILAEYNGQEYVLQYEDGVVEQDGILYREVTETRIRFRLKEPYYIRKFDLRVPLEEKGGYTLRVASNDKEKTLYSSIDPRIDAGIINVNAYGRDFEISFLAGEPVYTEEMTLTLSNSFQPNLLRVFLIFVLLSLTAMAFLWGDWLAARPQDLFAVSAFLLGSAMIWGVGTNQVGYDEYVHAKSAYDLSFGVTIQTTEAAMQLKGNLLPFFYTPQERELIEAYEQRNNDFSWADISTQSRMVRAENRVYYPNAIGFRIARIIGADFATSVELAKFGGLICYILVMYAAISLARRYQILVTAIALLPNNLFMACSLTRDMVVTAFLMLGTVLLMNEFLETDRKLTWQSALAIILAFVFGSVSKPVYIVMLLLLVFLSKTKFENRVQEIVFKLAVCAVVGLMIYDIFHPTPVSTTNHQLVGNYAYAGDKRATGTSNMGQMQYILSNPFAYTVLLLKSMLGMITESLTVDSFLNYGYLGKAPVVFTWLALLLGLWLSIWRPKDEGRKVLSKASVILTALMLFGTAAVIWTSLYVSYTAVGSGSIEGVQGRYFIPLFVPLFVCFFTRQRRSRLTKKNISRIAFLLMSCMNWYMIFRLVLYSMNV